MSGLCSRSARISARMKSTVCSVTNRFQSSVRAGSMVSPCGAGDSICSQSVKVWLQKAVYQERFSRPRSPS